MKQRFFQTFFLFFFLFCLPNSKAQDAKCFGNCSIQDGDGFNWEEYRDISMDVLIMDQIPEFIQKSRGSRFFKIWIGDRWIESPGVTPDFGDFIWHLVEREYYTVHIYVKKYPLRPQDGPIGVLVEGGKSRAKEREEYAQQQVLKAEQERQRQYQMEQERLNLERQRLALEKERMRNPEGSSNNNSSRSPSQTQTENPAVNFILKEVVWVPSSGERGYIKNLHLSRAISVKYQTYDINGNVANTKVVNIEPNAREWTGDFESTSDFDRRVKIIKATFID